MNVKKYMTLILLLAFLWSCSDDETPPLNAASVCPDFPGYVAAGVQDTQASHSVLIDFKSRISSIQEEVGPIIIYSDYLRSIDFVEILENPGVYKNCAIWALAADDVSESEKRVSINLMRNLRISDQIHFANIAFELFQEEVISEYLLMEVVANPFLNNPFETHYRNRRVRRLLREIGAYEQIASHSCEAIRAILRGEGADDWGRYLYRHLSQLDCEHRSAGRRE